MMNIWLFRFGIVTRGNRFGSCISEMCFFGNNMEKIQNFFHEGNLLSSLTQKF